MLMRRNVAAGIGSNEQGEYCRAALQRWIAKSRDINRLLYFDLGGWLHTEMVYPPVDGHPSKY